MTDPAPTKVKKSKGKTAFIVIGVVVAVAVAGLILLTVGKAAVNVISTPQPPSTVTISGSVITKGFQTHPTAIALYDQSSGQQEMTQVGGTHYQIDAPNGSYNWRIIVTWSGIGGSTGQCDGGFVQYSNTMSRYITQDVTC
ncbi:MAG TPA: hypothetical protein VGQ13_06070 [Nitrososphaera sp.]|jgi:hypothetical protein|nr:hypothetical protein [Nitrososphaera sp.]